MGLTQLTGEILDEKYRIEKELGKGGMGSVYLATHLGTSRPVAVKVITPQFMMNDEFVERFRREARAAGRLHHPNVVNVTDFGFASVEDARIAYLVMEYLDGCTLADVLAEESQLPIDWVIDIIEQTSSAVDEAHQQGIVHRDLKPDNIWLEPNRRGGYTVKVLDFGLAKLGDVQASEDDGNLSEKSSSVDTGKLSKNPATLMEARRTTGIVGAMTFAQAAEASEATTESRHPDEENATLVFVEETNTNGAEASEATTQIRDAGSSEAETLVHSPRESEDERTRVFEHTTAQNRARETAHADGLTRVGSILGTPVYMSPEQCRSEPLDARSDIYSLGVIAYQMLAGEPPFTGQATELLQLHMEASPAPLREKRRKVPKKMAAVVMSALAKSPADRPASAAGFASAFRATSEGTGALLRRAFALYIEHFPKFFRVTLLTYLPLIALQAVLLIVSAMGPGQSNAETTTVTARGINFTASASGPLEIVLSIVTFFANFIINAFIIGATIRLVTQLYLSPLRPLQVKTAYLAVKKRLKPLLWTLFISSIRWILGLVLFLVPGIIMFIRYSLAGPVVMMEGLKGKAALMRSKALVKRCWRSVVVVLFLQWAIPMIAGALVAAPVAIALKLGRIPQAPMLTGRVSSLLVVVLNVIIVPLIATLLALLYLKARQIGGETLKEVLGQFEEEDIPRTKWQMRMRERLQTTSKS